MENRKTTIQQFAVAAGNYIAYGSSGLAFGSTLYLLLVYEVFAKFPGGNGKNSTVPDIAYEILFLGLLLPLLVPLPCLFLARQKPIIGAGSLLCIGLSTVVIFVTFLATLFLLCVNTMTGWC